MKSLSRQHPYIGMSSMYIAEVLYNQDKTQEAYECAQEAFDILQATLPQDHRRIAESAFILGKISKKITRNDQALEYAYKARDIQLTTLSVDHDDVRKTLELIQSIELLNDT